MKGIVILVKKDETYNILKSLLATRYCSRNERGIGWSKFLLEPAPSMFIWLLRPCFIKEQVSSPRHNFLLLFFHKIRITNVTLPARCMLKFNPWNPKGALFWWCLRAFSRKDFGKCSLSFLYSTCSKFCNMLQHCLQSIEPFCRNISFCINSCFLESDLPYYWKPFKSHEVRIL